MLNRDFSDFLAPDERPKLASIKLIRKAREITFLKKDHTPMYGLVSSIPLVFGTRLPHALCFIANITETKLAAEKLKDANLTLRALNNALLDLSLRDVRTGVYNTRYLNERLAEEIKRAKRYLRPFSLILMDIDFFKVVNDSYGHGFGDVVLKDFSELLKRTVRETDIVIRSGGEEFVVFLSDTDAMGAWVVAQKITKALERSPLGDDKRKVTMTASLGICSYPESGLGEAAALLDAVDEAMYESKRLGRNQITVYKKGSPADKTIHAGEAFWTSLDALKERLENIGTRNEESMLESLLSVVREIDRRLGYAPGHIDRVLSGAEKLALAFSLSAGEVQEARRVALLCNLGLVAVPQEVLQKKGPLSQEQFRLIREHPLHSTEALRSLPFLLPLEKDILAHHERYDGKGYPHGLKGEEIPLAARIVRVIDTFEALVSVRPYRPVPYAPEKALRIIREEAGRQFDSVVVDHFMKSFD
jgi:diguanylate cyclase (GGDEF)-like protein